MTWKNINLPLNIWNEDAYVSVKPIYWMDVAVISQRAGGRKINGLNGVSCVGSFKSVGGVSLASSLKYA